MDITELEKKYEELRKENRRLRKAIVRAREALAPISESDCNFYAFKCVLDANEMLSDVIEIRRSNENT